MTNEEIQNLISLAKKSRSYAFLPSSTHKIGAAVLTTDGFYYGGCNIESIIAGLGSCAEKVAINNAVAHGKYEFRALVVVDKDKTYPCGSCLQYLAQFHQTNNKNIHIIISDTDGKYKLTNLKKLSSKLYLTKSSLKKIQSYKNSK
jgi:cytidine deaminase